MSAEIPLVWSEMPPMPIKEGECGYCAQIADSEGNRLGLWAMQL
ncbi:hypothetical protein [Shewanella algae]